MRGPYVVSFQFAIHAEFTPIIHAMFHVSRLKEWISVQSRPPPLPSLATFNIREGNQTRSHPVPNCKVSNIGCR